MLKLLLFAIFSAVSIVPAAEPALPSGGKKSLKILGIGNSFLRNATSALPKIVSEAGHELTLGVGAPGGRSLKNHYDAAMISEENPDDPRGRLYEYKSRKMSLKEILTAEKWDIVTIQQASPESWKSDSFRPYARNLLDYIKKYAPDAEVVYHQTWAWRPDHTRMGMDKQPAGFMYRELTRNYHASAREIGIKRIIPVGDAFQLAAESPEWKFERDPDFDYADPEYPSLPNEKNSIHGGFAWRTPSSGDVDVEVDASKLAGDGAGKVFRLDGSHANATGCYLAACVWFEFLYGEDVRKVESTPSWLTPERAASLREIAHQAVNGLRPKAWPADVP